MASPLADNASSINLLQKYFLIHFCLTLSNYLLRMKKLIAPIMFLFCASVIVAQTTAEDYYNPPKPKLLSRDKVSTSISMGTGVSFLNSTKNAAYTTFIAPKIGYLLTSKFKLNVGFMHYIATGNTFMPLNQNEAIYNSSNKTFSGNLVLIEGQYQLNKRMTMSGAVMYDANEFNNNKQNNYKAASLGLDYKLTRTTSIGFKATLSQGSGNYMLNPKTNSFDYNPYSNGVFPLQNAMFGLGEWGAGQLNSPLR